MGRLREEPRDQRGFCISTPPHSYKRREQGDRDESRISRDALRLRDNPGADEFRPDRLPLHRPGLRGDNGKVEEPAPRWNGREADNMKKIPYSQTYNAGFTSGIIYSAATLMLIQQEWPAEQLIRESGLSWKDLRKVKADPVDREMLRKIKRIFAGEKP